MKLVRASLDAPEGLDDFLRELGSGEHGFGGTHYAAADESLSDFLQRVDDMSHGRGLRAEQVPMTTHWLLDDADRVAGMSKPRIDRGHRRQRREARGRAYGR